MVDLVDCKPKLGEITKGAGGGFTKRSGLPDGGLTLPTAVSGGSEPLFLGGVVTPFKGRTKPYLVETHRANNSKNGFLDREDDGLREAVTGLALRVYPDRNRDLLVDRLMHSLSHPRGILELLLHQGILVGYGLFARFNIDGEPLLYSSRAILSKHEGQGAGTHLLAKGIREHQEDLLKSHRVLRWGALMTMTPLSPRTLEKIPEIDSEEIYPFKKRYNQNREAQGLMLGLHREVYMYSLGIDTITGVSKGELSELGMNDTWRPRPDAGRVWQIYQEMVSPPPTGLGMNREAGDVVYVLFRIRRPVGLVAP